MEKVKIFQVFLLLLLFGTGSSSGDILQRRHDASVLRHLRYTLQVRNFYWPKFSNEPCSTWRGIQCDEQGQVVGIHLAGLKRSLTGMSRPTFSVEPLRQLSSSLRYLNASGFVMQGTIPYWFGELTKLQVLDLSYCLGIQGNIPYSFGQLENLEFLSLAGNMMSGSIPYSFGSLVKLSSLDLSSNNLNGQVPDSVSNMLSLVKLDLSNNSLVEAAFGDMDRLGNLTILKMSRNIFRGPIPEELSRCRDLEVLDLSHNLFTGGFPVSYTSSSSLAKLRELDISYNKLSGTLVLLLPLAGFDNKMQRLVLSHNEFFGPVPEAFISRLKNMSLFDISTNFFNGTFTKTDDDVADGADDVFSLTDNCFENVARQRHRMECEAFYASRGLNLSGQVGLLPTATPLVGITYPSPEDEDDTRSHRLKKTGGILGGIFGSLAFIVLVVVVVVHMMLLRDKRRRPPASSRSDKAQSSLDVDTGPPGTGTHFPVMNITVNLSCIGEAFSYSQLQRATGDFNPVNLIKAGHTGDLYRGVIDGGILVVVKRVDVTTIKREFLLSELEVFSKASHTRLVPLLGHCLEREDDKFLVYKYMQYGDLGQALHRKIIPSPPKDILQSLDWITRLKIAIGAAEGLTYLHHECSPPLVHRDIKASSILLDDKFEVRLGSMSEARIEDGGSQPGLIMRFLRRSQTSEQVPDSTVASCAYDVYCFGKVLLELVTGKLGISGTTDADTWLETSLPLIDRHEKENLTRIVDPSLLVDDDLLEEVWAVAIVAKMCLNPKHSKRPAIRHVLKALENPLRVVREENFTASIRRSSHSSWNASLFGSWRHSSSETIIPAATLKEEHSDHHHHHRRAGSNEIFPEPP